jgi:hypothetical protein
LKLLVGLHQILDQEVEAEPPHLHNHHSSLSRLSMRAPLCIFNKIFIGSTVLYSSNSCRRTSPVLQMPPTVF